MANLQASTFALMAGICYTIVLESYAQILEALINEYKIYNADDRLKKKLDLARKLPFTDSQKGGGGFGTGNPSLARFLMKRKTWITLARTIRRSWVRFRRLVRQLQREGRPHMEVKAFLSEHIVVTVHADGHRHKIFQLLFGKDGSMYVTFPYFQHSNGILAEVTVDGPPGTTAQVDLVKTGKVASHLVKYAHHPDGEAHFSQHGKILTVIRRRSVPLIEQDGHIFTVLIQGLRAFDSVGNTTEHKVTSKRTTLTFAVKDKFPRAIRFIGRWYWTDDLPIEPRLPVIGPQIQAVESDGITHNALVVPELCTPPNSVLAG